MWEFPMCISRLAAAEEASFHPLPGLLTLDKYFKHHFQTHSTSSSVLCAALPTKSTARRVKASLAMSVFLNHAEYLKHWKALS